VKKSHSRRIYRMIQGRQGAAPRAAIVSATAMENQIIKQKDTGDES
jgi:hypothetical protein